MLYLFNLAAFLKTFTSVTDEKRPLKYRNQSASDSTF